MKAFNTIMKIAAALAAVAGIAFVVYKYWDKIMEKLDALKSKCPCCCAPEDEAIEAEEIAEEASEEAAEAVEAAEEAVEEAAPEAAPAEENTVTEADFAD